MIWFGILAALFIAAALSVSSMAGLRFAACPNPASRIGRGSVPATRAFPAHTSAAVMSFSAAIEVAVASVVRPEPVAPMRAKESPVCAVWPVSVVT